MPDFNNLIQECVPKIMRAADDLHQMVDYNRDSRNMMIALLTINGILLFIILALLTIIGILIFFNLKYRNEKQKRKRRSNRGEYRFNDIRSEHSSIGNRYMKENSDAFMSKVHLFDDVRICGECRFQTYDINEFANRKYRKCSNITKAPSEPKSIQCCENTFESSWKLLQHLTDKHNLNLYRDASTTDDSQERRSPQPPSPLSSESIKSEQNYSTTLIMNDDHICIPISQLNIPTPTTPPSMPYYSDSTAATYCNQPLTTSVSATPSISSLINSEIPSMIKARVFVGNLNACVSREDFVGLFKCCGNVLGATLFKGYALIQFSSQTEAKLSVQILNGYTWEGSTLDVKILKLQSTKDAIDRSNLLNVHIHNSCEPVFNRATNTAHSLAAFAGENRHSSVNFAPAGPMGGGSSTMTAVDAPMPGGGSSTMTAVGAAPHGASTMTAVGAPMGGGGSSTMTAVGGAGGGGAPSAPVVNSNVSRTDSRATNTAHSLAAFAGENRHSSVNFDQCR